jgi:hypothetical protein
MTDMPAQDSHRLSGDQIVKLYSSAPAHSGKRAVGGHSDSKGWTAQSYHWFGKVPANYRSRLEFFPITEAHKTRHTHQRSSIPVAASYIDAS